MGSILRQSFLFFKTLLLTIAFVALGPSAFAAGITITQLGGGSQIINGEANGERLNLTIINGGTTSSVVGSANGDMVSLMFSETSESTKMISGSANGEAVSLTMLDNGMSVQVSGIVNGEYINETYLYMMPNDIALEKILDIKIW